MSSGDASFTYTADGFVASKDTTEGTTSYAYSGLGELLSVDLPDGRVVTYSYDASGRRTSKALDGTVTERYVWADATRLLAIYDGAGTQLYRFLYADSRVPFAADTPQGRIFFSYDQVGSLRAVSDASGAVLETRAHDSFGNVIGPSAPAKRSPLGFAGGHVDADTGLVLFGARDYDPTLGRWVAKDPIGFAGGDVNLYGYCLGDPVGLVDPSGTTTNYTDESTFLTLDPDMVEAIAVAAINAVNSWNDFANPMPSPGPAAIDGTAYGARNGELRRSTLKSDCPSEDLEVWVKYTVITAVGEVPIAGSIWDFGDYVHTRRAWITGRATYGDLLAAKANVIPAYGGLQWALDATLFVNSGPYPDGTYIDLSFLYAEPRR